MFMKGGGVEFFAPYNSPQFAKLPCKNWESATLDLDLSGGLVAADLDLSGGLVALDLDLSGRLVAEIVVP